ncbi:kunitz trypsin inhibitor 5-like [Lycium barbarum]|uniref:kunitz trypsin inhibitor 5-like n=1 Tax=Lycium barbarum TaxID=112863 RepID=UPI00293ECA15|nr:kunitz trypsin inhibitor 5-like [Lycium barbarum]
MKISGILLLFFTLFQVIKADEVVLDTDKDQVRPGQNYYILPATTGKGGGLTLAKGENGSCPLNVFQEQNSKSVGLPIKLLMVNSASGLMIYINEDINIKFAAPRYVSMCNKSIVWEVDKGFVTTDGTQGGMHDTSSCLFTIQKYEDAYAIQFCPRATGCSFVCPRLKCGYIGISPAANGARRLAVNAPVFKIVFKKAY